MIEVYSFGKITINGQTFTKDIIIFPDKIESTWWRKSGHRVCLQDLDEIFSYKFDTLVIGTGFYGLVKLDNDVIKHLGKKGIELIAVKTKRAVQIFNEQYTQKKIIGAFHLTC